MEGDVLETASEVTVSATRKKQFNQYEPATSEVEVTAEADSKPEDMTTAEYVAALQERAGELAEEDIMRKFQAHINSQIDEE